MPKPEWSMFEHDTLYYQKKGYVRGAIWHHRSNATQQWLFHFLYGGFNEFYIKRFFINYIYKKWIRLTWFPVTCLLIGSFIGQRDYDNNAYDYFYFTDCSSFTLNSKITGSSEMATFFPLFPVPSSVPVFSSSRPLLLSTLCTSSAQATHSPLSLSTSGLDGGGGGDAS